MKLLRMIVILVTTGLMMSSAHAQKNGKLNHKIIGKGQPVIMIPGLTCSGDVWNETVEALGKGYEYHLLTFPGFAGVAPIKNVNNDYLEQVQELILKYIKKNRIKKPIIMGHSLGGSVALSLAIKKPSLLSKLIIVDAFPFMLGVRDPNMTKETAEKMASAYKDNLIKTGKKPLAEKTANQKEFLKFMITSPAKIDVATQWYLDSDIETVGQAMYELNTMDLRNDLGEIEVPTLVLGSWIAGKPYGATRESSIQLYKTQYEKLKNIEIDMSDKGKHFIMWDDPTFFNNRISKFMSK